MADSGFRQGEDAEKISESNILVTIISLSVLGFGLSFLLETSALLVLVPVASTTAVFISITSDAACASYQSIYFSKRKYPFSFSYCAWNFCYLVFYLIQDCGKGISETGYYLMITILLTYIVLCSTMYGNRQQKGKQ